MTPGQREGRPTPLQDAPLKPEDTTHVTAPTGGLDAADALTLAQRADHAVLVVTATPRGGTRSRVYLSLSSADGALRRASKRGAAACAVLVRLDPVNVAPGALAAALTDGEGR